MLTVASCKYHKALVFTIDKGPGETAHTCPLVVKLALAQQNVPRVSLGGSEVSQRFSLTTSGTSVKAVASHPLSDKAKSASGLDPKHSEKALSPVRAHIKSHFCHRRRLWYDMVLSMWWRGLLPYWGAFVNNQSSANSPISNSCAFRRSWCWAYKLHAKRNVSCQALSRADMPLGIFIRVA